MVHKIEHKIKQMVVDVVQTEIKRLLSNSTGFMMKRKNLANMNIQLRIHPVPCEQYVNGIVISIFRSVQE